MNEISMRDNSIRVDFKTNQHVTRCQREIRKIRHELIHVNRIIILSQHFSESLSKNKRIFNENGMKYIFQPTELSSFLGLSQHIQNTGFFISYIHQNPDILSTIISKNTNCRQFEYIIECVIPSLYGFFSTREHLEIASKFYDSAIKTCNAKVAKKILKPLLLSGVCSRFIESVAYPFIRSFKVDSMINAKSDKLHLVPIYSNYLITCIKNSIPLLPPSIIYLYQCVENSKWAMDEKIDLFFKNFIFESVVKRSLNSLSTEENKLLNIIFEYTLQKKEEINSLLNCLPKTLSLYNLPSGYYIFSQRCLNYNVCSYDMNLLKKLFSKCRMIPRIIRLNELYDVGPPYCYQWFDCPVFPKKINFYKDEMKSFIFDNSLECDGIDKLMIQIFHKNELDKYKDMMITLESLMIAPAIKSKMAFDIKHWNQVGSIFKDVEDMVYDPKLLRMYSLLKLEVLCSEYLVDYETVLNMFSVLLNDIIKDSNLIKEIDSCKDFSSLAKSIKSSFQSTLIASIRCLSCLSSYSLSDHFDIIINAFQNINQIVSTEKKLQNIIFPIIFQQIQDITFVKSFLILNSFMLTDSQFDSLCSDNEKIVWVKLESFILTILRKEPNCLQVFSTIQENLTQIFKKSLLNSNESLR